MATEPKETADVSDELASVDAIAQARDIAWATDE